MKFTICGYHQMGVAAVPVICIAHPSEALLAGGLLKALKIYIFNDEYGESR